MNSRRTPHPELFDAAPAAGAQKAEETLPDWLGLVTNHRRLFDAGQDGWMRPLGRSGFVLGAESFVAENAPGGRNAIPVRLTLDAERLPFLDARKTAARRAADSTGEGLPLVHWRAPLPLYAVRKMEVPSPEQRSHLLAMAGRFANVCLPSPDVGVSDFTPPPVGDESTPSEATGVVELPNGLNAIHGAMAMAVWAAPRQEPWMDVLHGGLEQDAARVAERAAWLGAGWLQLPWLIDGAAADERVGVQGRLWQGALSRMRWTGDAARSPEVLAVEIAKAARGDSGNRDVDAWLDRTRRIVTAEEPITCNGWRQTGAGLAIQLALLRPEPATFKAWTRDLPGLPPAVWWAAAVLCGWRQGYRSLDRAFRGNARLQELLATRALAASWPGGGAAVLPPSQQSPVGRAEVRGWFALTWRGNVVVRRPWGARAKWSNADLTGGTADRAARDLAGRLAWSCLKRRLVLPEGVPALGNARLEVEDGVLVVKGGKILRLPDGVDVDERFDPDEFRRQLATEAGEVPDPPTGPSLDRPRASRPERVREVPGLIYQPDFITEEMERDILVRIDSAEWSEDLKRNVQHYGWRYDYAQRQIDESARLGELPGWAQELAACLVEAGLVNDRPDQVIVNEYLGDQGISRHVDRPRDFADRVATISLLETWSMLFRRRGSDEKFEKPLERRSVAVLAGDARYKWTHEIPKRKYESRTDRQGGRIQKKREWRISLTFRKTLRRGG